MRYYVKPYSETVAVRRRGHTEYVIEIKPRYEMNGEDMMMKGGRFYAVLDKETGMWSTDEINFARFIDRDLYEYRDKISKPDSYGVYRTKDGDEVVVKTIGDSRSKELINYRSWESRLPPNFNYRQLDNKLTFLNDEVKPSDYRSKRLNYNLEDGSIEGYESLMNVLYSPEDRQKLEWAIGSIYAGDSSSIEKIIVLYGDPGTGKSTVLDLIKNLFDGYWSPFVAEDLARKSDQFATSVFKGNPLLAIQDDGSLARIESPIINEIVSHKDIIVNEKGKQRYHIRPNAMLFLATNELVDIRDTKLGISRRLLDVYPTGDKLPVVEYRRSVKQMQFEYSAIAKHCLDVYKKLGKEYYLNYSPFEMIKKTNIMRNFIFDNYDKFKANDPVTRDTAYEWYKAYFEESGLGYPPKRLSFGEQLRQYFDEYREVKWVDGKSRRHVYSGFKAEIFNGPKNDDKLNNHDAEEEPESDIPDWLQLKASNHSVIFDELKNALAQYAKEDDTPSMAWSKCRTVLKDIDESKVHYVLTQSVEPSLIVIDFDIRDREGQKSFKENAKEAGKWPKTYAELSKGGEGIHLHYFYSGDAEDLASVYSPNVEIKVFTGKQALRRRLTKCNDLAIATLSAGSLPLKGDKRKMLNWDGIQNEKMLRTMIEKNLNKEYHASTKPSVDYICSLIEDAYAKGLHYDVSDLKQDILAFASGSTHHSKDCIKAVMNLHYRSDDLNPVLDFEKDEIIFYDVEVFPNLFVVCYKKENSNEVIQMINPTADDIRMLCKAKLVGFNNRRYDNHILYARMLGYSNQMLFDQSQKIIEGSKNAFFGEAYNLSYTDIYDFSAKKQSLKKFEIELGIHHQENHYPWDKPVDKEHWNEIADYCCNDVRATEAVFKARYADFEARQALAKIAGGTVNDTTNSLTTKLIFGNNKHPQSEFVYTDLSTIFPGYEFKNGKSTYKGVEVGEGGYVYADHGMWRHVKTFDVASMHPHSAIALNIFGDRYTARFKDLVDARIAIKHKDKETLKVIFGGAFAEYADAPAKELKNLAQALKIAINSVYGLTAAKFENPFHDPRNIDNIVAKRGALFMVTLKEKVKEMGGHVVHIKTDSIKVENPSKEIEDFIISFGKKYGYDFEIESMYERMCLVNDAVYIAQRELEDPDWIDECKDAAKNGSPEPTRWTATGAQFAQPYVFKTLFSHQPIAFSDMCETRNVSTALYLDFNEDLPNVEIYESIADARKKKAAMKKLTGKETKLLEDYSSMSDDDLAKAIDTGHNYIFVGKIGQFCPIAPGKGGGILLREGKTSGSYSSAPNASGYRWMEAEMVKESNKQSDIDIEFYREEVETARSAIIEQCNNDEDLARWFISGEPWPLLVDELPF